MKTQLIMLDTPIIVSDEEIKANEWFYSPKLKAKQIFGKSEIPKDRGFLKIIAGIEGLPSINWNGLEEEFGLLDLQKILDESEIEVSQKYRDADKQARFTKFGHIAGIKAMKKIQSLNEKKFSLEDMKSVYIQGTNDGAEFESIAGDYGSLNDIEEANNVSNSNMEYFIQSLYQPKVFDIEVEMEVIPDYNNYGTGEIFHNNKKEIPKITDNSIKILRKL